MLLHKLSNLDIIDGVTGVTRTHIAFGEAVTAPRGYQFSYRYIKRRDDCTIITLPV